MKHLARIATASRNADLLHRRITDFLVGRKCRTGRTGNSVLLLILLFSPLPASVVAQSPANGEPDKEYAKTMKEIVFQNDSQWEDSRWQQSDVGPFLAGSISSGRDKTLKGIAIVVGDKGEAAVCFDTARMRISSAWTGELLKFDARRFGLIRPPAAAGKMVFTTKKLAGWARDGRFQPKPDEITHPEVARWYAPRPPTVSRLPKGWAHYQGLYTNGKRVVLSYTVGKTNVLESPWYVSSDDQDAFIRSLEIGPATETMQMMVADSGSEITVIGRADVSAKDNEDLPVLIVAPHENTIRVKLLITKKGADADSIKRLRTAAGEPENLSQMIKDDPGRFPEVLLTEGQTTKTSESESPYVIDTLTLPFDNPWKALLFTAGHDFFSNGVAAICTVQGDVWTVGGIDRDLNKLRWRRFATGLHQPLGLKIVDDKVYVIGRNQITRLHDRNDDGEADFYENFNNDMIIAPNAHDFVTCLDTDPQGNFYFIHARSGVMKVSADGSAMTSVADGFRNPNGMGVGPDGTITAAPQQGKWTPESSLIVVKQDGYYGYGGPNITKDRPTGWDLPMCFIPRSMDNSGGGQVWVEGDRWGPLTGKMLHLSYGQCRMLLALTEEVDGKFQGGTIQFPTSPGDFESGIMRGRFSPHDGQLYVSGLRGWQTRSIRDGCFQRVRYTGGPVHLPVAVKTYTNGIKLTFAESLDKDVVENPGNYFVEQWNYKYSEQYGSPDYSVKNPGQQGRDEVPVESATLMDGNRAVFLEMPGRQPVNQIKISWLLNSANERQFRGSIAHTINSAPKETIGEALIVRRERPRFVSIEVEKRLKPGLEFAFKSIGNGETDRRVARLVALNQSIENSPTPFLPEGAFQLTIEGTLRTPLSGFYDFKIDGTDRAQFWINDKLVLNASDNNVTAKPTLLHKGHNRIRIRYASPDSGNARLLLSWKGHNFGWEPVPPTVLFHDPGAQELLIAQQRRLGRELFANHRCAACHQTEISDQAMFELSFAGPDLSTAGDRFTADWLQNWLLSPSSFRPTARMPAVLGTGEQAKQGAADITAFLIDQHGNGKNGKQSDEDSKERLDTGAMLYEELGCISCHHFALPEAKDEFDRLSLAHVNLKYQHGALRAFLKKPSAHYASIRMPDFRLSDEEAHALATFMRGESKGEIEAKALAGNSQRGQTLFADRGCQQCHSIGKKNHAVKLPQLRFTRSANERGCLADDHRPTIPHFAFTIDQKQALKEFLSRDLDSLSLSDRVETSHRLFANLKCANCHDRDGQRSHRPWVMIEEGSGRAPEFLPELTWSGEKLQPEWTDLMISGKLTYKSRPWLKARMPAFPAYAERLAHGLAAEHGVDPHENQTLSIKGELTKIGKSLSLQTGLDCRQCHAIGDQQPRGDKDTKIALGINFAHIRDRMRWDAYQRFMLDPPRYDIKTKMIRLSEDGRTTKLNNVFDSDAKKQFDAVWHYIQSLEE